VSTAATRIIRWTGLARARARDELALEEPLEIRIDTQPAIVTMRTPGHDEELAAGYLFSEGLIRSRQSLTDIRVNRRNRDGNSIDVFLAPGVSIDLPSARRPIIGSSCGICGKNSIRAVRKKFQRLRGRATISAALIAQLPARLRTTQRAFDQTGGLHAAGIFNADGTLVVAREDIGRHNAVDKVIGFGFLHELLPFDHHVLVVSGRASFEIVQKSLAARIPIVCAVSAPSSLAVELARDSGQTLIGFARAQRLNVYSGSRRVRFDSN
jgi:FdhD protein